MTSPIALEASNSMLLSHAHKFIFFKTVKTAGSSIETALQRLLLPSIDPRAKGCYAGPEGIVGARGSDVAAAPFWNHMSAREVRDRVGDSIFSEYTKVTAIRNPFEKVVSWFFFGIHKRSEFDRDRALFNDFIHGRTRLPVDRAVYTINGELCCQRLIRYETLQQDVDSLVRFLCDDETLTLKLGLEKVGMRDRSIPFEKYYDPKSRDIVFEAFDFEFQTFGYTFET